MAKQSTHLRFLLSLGNTKMVVFNDEDNLHIYSSHPGKVSPNDKIAAERVTEALAK